MSSEKIKQLFIPPTPIERIKHTGVDFLISILGRQLTSYWYNMGKGLSDEAGGLLDQSRRIIYSGQNLTHSQINLVEGFHLKASILMHEANTLNKLEWVALGVSFFATMQMLYNGVQLGIEAVRNMSRDN